MAKQHRVDPRRRIRQDARSSPYLLAVLFAFFFAHARASSQLELRSAAARQNPVTPERIVLVQNDGAADTVQSYPITLPTPLQVVDVEFLQTSSNSKVLAVNDNQNILISTGESGQSVNLTVSNSFDGMVGETDYVVACRRKDTGEVLFSSAVQYVVCGVSFYRITGDFQETLVSGEQPQYAISYEDAIATPYGAGNEIHVLVQYPDGSTSKDITSGSVPKQSGLAVSVSDFRAQFVHNAVTCNMAEVGTFVPSTGLVLAPGCGYGLYRNEKKELCFGIAYIPYRAGGIVFDISWDNLVDSVPSLAEEGYSEKMQVSITGLPPIVVTKVEPLDFLFRPEGGQAIVVYFYNGDLRSSSTRRMVVENATLPFSELRGSFEDSLAPRYVQTAIFITEAGQGSNLPFSFQYASTESGLEATYQEAKLAEAVEFTMTYDTNPIKIDSISPAIGLQDGGQTVTVTGYFKGFDSKVDGIYFNGARLPTKYYYKVSDTEIQFTLPPRSEIGEGFDYGVVVRVGNAASKAVEFQYTITSASVVISMSGTTQLLGESIYRLGNCTPGRMTAVVSPFTSQIQSYEWSLIALTTADEEVERLTGLQNPSVNKSAQTLELQPQHLLVGQSYILKVKVVMLGTTALTSITLVREDAITVGAYILEPPARTIAYPETPLRLTAIVRTPTSGCYNGTNGLVFEWTGFGKTQRYSPNDATGEAAVSGEIVTTAARLGWEFLVPQSALTAGDHEVSFKTWMESNPLVSGSATRIVKIRHTPLQAVIRGGESLMMVNRHTDVEVTGANSVDPDKAYSSSTSVPTYQWACLETTGAIDFSDESAVAACDSGFLPNGVQAEAFTVRKELLEALPADVKALQYRLIVQSESRVSQPSRLTLVLNFVETTQSHLTGYNIQLQDADRYPQDINHVKYYQAVVLDVVSPVDDVSWTFEMVSPPRQNILTSSNLIQTPVYYSPDATGTGGNRKPLGIEASKLDPGTSYTLKVTFSGSASFEDTDIFISFKTSDWPVLNLPEPSVMDGTTLTQYTATAGIPQDDFEYSYYFILQDESGKDFCVGGCTGYGITYFRIGRPGIYKLSVLLYDSQGTALLRRLTLSRPLVVTEPDIPHDMFSELSVLFANGDDSSWTQLSYDMTTLLLNEGLGSNASVRIPSDGSLELSPQVVSDQDKIVTLSDGLRKIICASRPSSGHSALAVDVATKLSTLASIAKSTFYDITGTVSCCVQNTPKGTALTFELQEMLDQLERHVTNGAGELGSGRRRLLQEEGNLPPANMRADLNSWSGKMITASTTSSESEGFTATMMDGKYGIAMVANKVQLPVVEVNGNRQNGIQAGKSDEGIVFYTKGECAADLFAATGDQKRFITVQSMSNFITEDRFQNSPPPGGYLSDTLFLTQVYKEDEYGQIVEMTLEPRQDIDPCYCHKLPIKYGLDQLNEQLGSAPSMFSLLDKKPYHKEATKAGEYFNYVVDEAEALSYNIKQDGSESWVEVCSRGVGFAGSTISTKSGLSASAGGVKLFGKDGAGLVGMVLAGLIVVVVAVVASWVIATKTMAAGAPEPVALEAHELYVERDIYGRGTIFGSGKSAAAKAAKITAATGLST
jgi:REJ domain/IPT/TIG domain